MERCLVGKEEWGRGRRVKNERLTDRGERERGERMNEWENGEILEGNGTAFPAPLLREREREQAVLFFRARFMTQPIGPDKNFGPGPLLC